jgi:two-component system response regulator CpxR
VRILLIDDDAELCGLLVEFLSREGFSVECEHEGTRGLAKALAGGHDLVILDVMLPGLDGFEILRRLRAHSRLPILMLTARGDDMDRISGLEMGADDYLAKPFNSRELVARIRAILRRLERPPSTEGPLEVNGVRIDPGTREAAVNGQKVELTTFEFDILELLLRSAGKVLSRDDLMEHLYNRKATAFDRSVDMHISHLRKKLETAHPLIKTIRGVGYQFCRTPEEAEKSA